MYTYKALFGLSPDYVVDMLTIYHPRRPLRSSTKSLLERPVTATATYGNRYFSASAPAIWNELPDTVKNADSLTLFKKALKTHYFQRAYECVD